MNNLVQIDLISYPADNQIPGKIRTPGDIGNSLFRDLLRKTINSSPGENGFGVSPLQETGLTGPGPMTMNTAPWKNLSQDSDNSLAVFNLLMGQGAPSDAALSRLVALLKNRGLSQEKINQLILSAKANNRNSLVIQSSHIPGVEAVLLNMGLGVGEVKEIIEKSINGKGELVLSKLSKNLSEIYPDSISEKIVISLLEQFDISPGPKTLDPRGGKLLVESNPESALTSLLKHSEGASKSRAFTDFPQKTFQETEHQLKQNIAAILMEKGVPPQEIKAFLETLTMKYQATASNNEGSITAINTGMIEPDLKHALEEFSETRSQETRKEIKRNIASLLMEKGVLPQEVKSFLETLTVKHADTLLKNESSHKLSDLGPIEPDLQKALKDFSETASRETREKIKQDIASLLKEKGAIPREVKSFLDNLTVDSARALMKKGSPGAESTDFLNQVVMRTQRGWLRGGEKDKILSILKEEGLLILKDSGKNRFNEDGTMRLNLMELLKRGEQKGGTDLLHPFSGSGAKTQLGMGKDQKPAVDSRVKDASGMDPSLFKIDNDAFKPDALTHAKNPHNLPRPLPRILDRMIFMIRAGEQKGRFMIHPPELGRLDITLVIKHGHLQAQLGAENIMVKELIEANIHQLRQQLTDQGLIVDKFEVMVGLDDRPFAQGEMGAEKGRKGFSSNKRGEAKGDGQTKEAESGGSSSSIINSHQIDVLV